MRSIRAQLLLALLALAVASSLLAGLLTYRRVLAETSTLFDYQLRQMALSLRSQVSLAPRVELPPDQGDADFVVQIWDPFGARVYLSRPGLPILDRTFLGYADLNLQGEPWRAYGLQTTDGVIQVAQPLRVRETLARRAALRVIVPLLLWMPLLALAILVIVRASLRPLHRLAAEVEQRDAYSLAAVSTRRLPKEVEPLVRELNRLLARLEAAFTAQRAFTADAAHELRSPLTALRLQLQLLERAADEAARREARAHLAAAVSRATHLVEQLLTLSRQEPLDTLSELRPIALVSPVQEACADCSVQAQARRIDLRVDVDAGVQVPGDPEGLRILARNLIDNAIHYSPAGSLVRVSGRRTPAGALLRVVDQGPGIPPPDRERVFDRFYRRAADADGGSGLGLAIVKAIADRHHAQLSLDDAPDGGLQVSVAFPVAP
jgi:two-component system OmpR family sensor kinase/two-component system sensor histidine kinase QseC